MNISGFDGIVCIEKFEYLNHMDNHVLCSFSACIKAEDAEKALEMVDRDIDFENENFRFTGHITDVSVSNDISGVYIEVKTIGKTYSYDQDKFCRVFQQGNKTVSDILSHMKSMSDVQFEAKEDPVIENIIFQNNETEWTFIKRLVNRLGFHIFDKETVFIGKYGKDQTEIDIEELIVYRINSSMKGYSIFCRLDSSLEMGCQVKCAGKSYYVGSKKYILEKGKYYFEYELLEIKNNTITDVLENIYLYAKVTDNNDPDKKGRLQLNFENENVEDCMKDSPIWIDRMDFYANRGFGPVFVPQIDDIVRVHLFNGDCRIVGCVRTDAYGSPYNNSGEKYFLFDDEIFIKYADGKVTVHNKDNQVEMSGEEIAVTSGDNVSILAKGDSILVQKDKSTIEITSDIKVSAGNFVAEAESSASVTGSKVNIKGNSGVSIN